MQENTTDIETKSKTDSEKKGDVVIEMQHLKKSFGNNHVLRDINLTISKGENLAILGQSGTGKSVLIKCIVGLIDIDDGKLLIFGQDISELKNKKLVEIQKKIGFLFQSGALYDSMTVRENLEFPLRKQSNSLSKEELDSLIKESLHDVGLDKAIDKTPSELSGGMRKRLGLARTLILNQRLCFMMNLQPDWIL